MRPEPDQMRCDTRQFREQHADILRTLRGFDPQQLFYSQAIGQVIRKRREIIDTVGKRDGLRIGQRLARFLDSRVQVADFGYCFHNGLAVEFQDHAQHAVR